MAKHRTTTVKPSSAEKPRTVFYSHHAAVPAQEGRKSTTALYVMVTEDQKRRVEDAARLAGMTMRDYVVLALDAQLARQELDVEVEPQADGTTMETRPRLGMNIPQLNALMLRVGTLEKQVEVLQRRVESQWGPEDVPPNLARNKR